MTYFMFKKQNFNPRNSRWCFRMSFLSRSSVIWAVSTWHWFLNFNLQVDSIVIHLSHELHDIIDSLECFKLYHFLVNGWFLWYHAYLVSYISMMLVIVIVHQCNPTFYKFLIQSYVVIDWSCYLISTYGNKKLSV